MAKLTRRSWLRNSFSLVAAGTLARPYIANAAATTAAVWWVQGFAQEEDVSFKNIVADYEKTSGNTIDYSIVPYAPMRQKIVAAMTSGVVPDLFQNTPVEIIALYAWQDKLVDVSEVVETQREEYTETARPKVRCYNNVEKKRSYYGVAYTVGAWMNHMRRPPTRKAMCRRARSTGTTRTTTMPSTPNRSSWISRARSRPRSPSSRMSKHTIAIS